MDCLFCRLASKELSAEIIYEDDWAVGMLDVRPIAPGHALVVPKIHAQNILDLPDEAVGPLFLAVKKTTELIQKALKPDGFTIGINHGKMSGQAIDHLHVHIIPRFKNDGGRSIHSVVENPPKESLKEIRSKIIG